MFFFSVLWNLEAGAWKRRSQEKHIWPYSLYTDLNIIIHHHQLIKIGYF